MRVSFFAAALSLFCFPLVSSADCCTAHRSGCTAHHSPCAHHSRCAHHSHCSAPAPCGCGQAAPVQPSCAPSSSCGCSTCGVAAPSCGSCGCDTCGSNRCNQTYDYVNFNRNFYAEFYARNPWYLEAKKKEAAEKLKRYEATRS